MEVVGVLLGADADPNAQDRNGNTPLHLAVNLKQSLMRKVFRDIRVQFSDVLVEYRANSCVGNNQDVSPLDLARELGNRRLINLLTRACLDINTE